MLAILLAFKKRTCKMKKKHKLNTEQNVTSLMPLALNIVNTSDKAKHDNKGKGYSDTIYHMKTA